MEKKERNKMRQYQDTITRMWLPGCCDGTDFDEEIFSRPIGTKTVELSAIPINFLSVLNFLKFNPKDLVGSIKYGGGSVPAWGCKSVPELESVFRNIVTFKVVPFSIHTSAFGAAVTGNSSGTRFLEGPSGDSPFSPETVQMSCQVIYSQFGLAIHQNDHQARRRFVEWAQNEIAVVPDFHKRILFSDEAHFWLNGYVNKQNCRIWSEANPQVYVETPLHPEKLTVWCALWPGGILLQKR
ncbi:hypothetical protein TNCV_1661951 [Trichonephila clavipes]|nr:hypothetical protein TNCV_1661951 [Trichonephila clavipes]